ncbi:hypothetical protein PPL_01377 [Heterostelium album PN500]|uniref:Uncharacterized protein n=1 Tax=Heterostelium pallidum (strain ATCC 26659 / Pp 5 / PN500) TaxID=670386 RepID=D3AZ37_HETP5|nr:hypothetical protein PPL_01377 [Heterostelium album PN500]EFA85594.1 hypothetical protein PPL_01377 [Heterostelium album PN500]|eukprot:XP_020437701.1 hypothetical protein PPL_01377 [Heterostelium album PN500]
MIRGVSVFSIVNHRCMVIVVKEFEMDFPDDVKKYGCCTLNPSGSVVTSKQTPVHQKAF